jgi:hypothetical protein
MELVVEYLVLVLARSVINSTIGPFPNLPFESKFEIVGHLLTDIRKRASWSCPVNAPIALYLPIAGVLPAVEGIAIKKYFEIRLGRIASNCRQQK